MEAGTLGRMDRVFNASSASPGFNLRQSLIVRQSRLRNAEDIQRQGHPYSSVSCVRCNVVADYTDTCGLIRTGQAFLHQGSNHPYLWDNGLRAGNTGLPLISVVNTTANHLSRADQGKARWWIAP